jgi:serine/threonine-protein kinase mTOR
LDFYFDEAIELIREIKSRTKETLSSIKTIYLEQASDKLFKINQSKVFLFGTYSPHYKNVTIDSFKNQIEIIHSKQRPKKIVIIGSDQKEYNYLIKGKEDLRLDERIMQLFTFINKMFHSPSDKESYAIHGYSITPISYEIGIIAWVENCDTLGALVQGYRFENGVRVDNAKIESKLCRHIYPKYPDIEKYHKVEIYHEVCKQVSGMDLKNILAKRSETS